MFTGIIEETGTIKNIIPIAGGKRIKISARKILDDISVNDSVCVNGVCLTVTNLEEDGFWVDAVGATLDKTTFNEIKISEPVNLERSLRVGDRLGGHFVQGHVNGVGILKRITKLGDNFLLSIDIPKELERYLIKEGSIAVDGISLTIADLNGSVIDISLIPHTWNNTTIRFKREGDKVNIETDVMAKYVEQLIKPVTSNKTSTLTEEQLRKSGY